MDTYGLTFPEDLPPLETLWARAALVTVLRPELQQQEDGRIHYDDGGGNEWWLLRVEGGRALLIGQDHEADSVFAHEEGDRFEDGPDWLPWDWMLDLEAEENIGFAYWWDGHRWAHTPYPEDVSTDGVGLLLSHLFDVDDPTTWLDEEDPEPALARFLSEALHAARSRELTKERLAPLVPLLPRLEDPATAMTTASALGLTPGSSPTLHPSGHRRPLRPDMIGGFGNERDLRLGDTLRRTEEIPGRPTPEDGPELARLVDWARRERSGPDGRAILVHDAVTADWPSVPPGRELSEEQALWRSLVEAESHPEHGGWLYARLEVTEDGHTLQRAYDHWPRWWSEHAERVGATGLLHYGLVRWLLQRDPRWQPAWLSQWHYVDPPLTAPEGWDQPHGPEPGFPWRPLTPTEHDALLGELRARMVDSVEGEWTSLSLEVRCLVGTAGAVFHAVRPQGGRERLTVPAGITLPVNRLRSGMYERGTGTWYRAVFTLHRDGDVETEYDHDTEPDFGRRIADLEYQLDFRYFPREVAHLPAWMLHRIDPDASHHPG